MSLEVWAEDVIKGDMPMPKKDETYEAVVHASLRRELGYKYGEYGDSYDEKTDVAAAAEKCADETIATMASNEYRSGVIIGYLDKFGRDALVAAAASMIPLMLAKQKVAHDTKMAAGSATKDGNPIPVAPPTDRPGMATAMMNINGYYF